MSDPAQRLLVTPILSQTFSSRYKSDILVLMPFKDELKPVFEDHMKAVAQNRGMTIARADDFFTSERIMDEIWTAMVHAKIILADCTGRNPNVFYEIGLAHAIGKPTILVTQNDDDIPFDLRHRRYIKYNYTPREMKAFEESLTLTLRSILD
jgi:nucleoside 2-deoxyribosyltransferase